MQVKMYVHRVSTVPVRVQATVNGETTEAIISGLEVELTDPTHTQGSWLLKFQRRADVDFAKARFVPDTYVMFSLDTVQPVT